MLLKSLYIYKLQNFTGALLEDAKHQESRDKEKDTNREQEKTHN